MLVEADFKKIDIISSYYFRGEGVPDFYNANRKKLRWVLFFTIGTESRNGWPRRFVEVEKVKKFLFEMMRL